MDTVIDTNALIYLLDPRADPGLRDRARALLLQVQTARAQLIIPAQVVGEYLAGAGAAGQPILAALTRNRYILVTPFDHRAAVECAEMDRAAMASGNKRAPLARNALWQKVKVDRQVVAIAKAHGAEVVAEDSDILAIATAAKVPSRWLSSLPLPPALAQLQLYPPQAGTAPAARPGGA